MYAAHDAFRRDLYRLQASVAAGHASDPATRAGWASFTRELHVHHTVEDAALWPPLRQKTYRPDEVAVLDAMEAEHARIDPLLAPVEAAVAGTPGADPAESAEALASALTAHRQHEETTALPLLEQHLGQPGWDAFLDEIRKRQGLTGGARFLPWLLDGAPAETTHRVLDKLPPPARLLYRAIWRPNYVRTPRWGSSCSL
jgi:iron-sulfur cluster repair protein YtfE (RIC family)